MSEHVRSILCTIANLTDRAAQNPDDNSPWAGTGRWLHTLGYRGHVTTKSRRYSTTMTALRSARAEWTRYQNANHSAVQHNWGRDRAMVDWEFDHAGHATLGDRVLAIPEPSSPPGSPIPANDKRFRWSSLTHM